MDERWLPGFLGRRREGVLSMADMQSPGSQGLLNFLYGIGMGLISLVTFIIGYVLDVYRKKVDSLEKSRTDNAAHFVTRTELATYIDQAREDRQRMHTENLENYREIRGDIGKVHTRIDALKST
jgi:hypothetical protein